MRGIPLATVACNPIQRQGVTLVILRVIIATVEAAALDQVETVQVVEAQRLLAVGQLTTALDALFVGRELF